MNLTPIKEIEQLLKEKLTEYDCNLIVSLFVLVESNRVEVLKTIISNDNFIPKFGNDFLSYAIYENEIDISEILLSNPKIYPLINKTEAINETIKYGRDKIAKLLIKDWLPKNPLDLDMVLTDACIEGHTEIVKFLLQHKNINENAFDGAPIKEACFHGHIEIVKILLDIEYIQTIDCFEIAWDKKHYNIALLLINKTDYKLSSYHREYINENHIHELIHLL
jgi:ankyrin repeat protein